MRPVRKAKKKSRLDDWEEADDYSQMRSRARFITLICDLARVDPSRYEEWRDSMPDEFFAALCEELMSEETQKILYRAFF